MKQSRLYSEILEERDEETHRPNPVSNENQSDYSIHDAYNDWLAQLPDLKNEYQDIGNLGNDIYRARDNKYREALFLAEKATYDKEDLQTFLNGNWAIGWRDEMTTESASSHKDYLHHEHKIKQGIFASAFIEILDNEIVSIPSVDVEGIGYGNTSNIRVEGDVKAGSFCDKMSGGNVIVEGDITDTLGNGMTGGEIEVRGDADTVLDNEDSSTIKIEGDLRRYLGVGGTTRVSGNLEEITGLGIAGEVYVEGEINNLGIDLPEDVTIYQKQDGNWTEVFPSDSQ
ncbi:MAG: hypothetical protein ABEJ95_01140 [Candidatus Nanohalobium sp.]